MADLRLSKLFDRYRTHGDLTALAEVFDQISPDLLRVARHIRTRGIEPEDLVQATFLTAIERAAQFDPQRPLNPWLFGILVNHARRSLRTASRAAVEAHEEILVAPPDREHDVEAIEVGSTVARALDELPEKYREVLLLHLAEGKEPHVIADELGRPQGTVRAQIHRGLRILRRMLPSSLALGGLVAAPAGPLLRVREQVLADAARALGRDPGPSRVLDGRRSVRPTRRQLVAAGAAGILGLWVWFAWPTDRSVVPAPTTATASLPRAAVEPEEPLAESRGEPLREAVALRPAEAPPTAEEYGSLVVEVRAADGTSPIAGALVSMIPWGTDAWFDEIRESRTDAEGRAGFAHVHPGRVGVHVDRGVQSRVDVLAGRETVHRVTREPGVTLEVAVQDVQARPIAGACVDLFARRDEPAFRSSTPTDASGRVRIDDAPKEVFVAVRAAGFATSPLVWSSALTTVPGSGSTLAFTLDGGGLALRGAVVDEAGTPIAGARILATSRHAAEGAVFRADGSPRLEAAPASASSAPDGRFALTGLDDVELELTVEAPGRAPHVEFLGAEGGSFPYVFVHLEIERALHGIARFRDERPAAGTLVEAVLGRRILRLTRCGADGSFALDGLPAEAVTLRARAGGLGPPTECVVRLGGDRANEWNPVVESVQTIQGQAIGEDGRVLQTWLVLATPEDDPSSTETRLSRWARHCVPAPLDQLEVQCWIPLSKTFVLPCRSDGPHRVEVRARNAWRDPPQAILTGVRPGARDVVVRVSPQHSHLRGRLVDEQGAVIVPVRVVAIPDGANGELQGVIDALTGRFDVEVLATDHTLLVWTRDGALHVFDDIRLDAPATLDLGDLVVRACGSLELESTPGAPTHVEARAPNGLRFELARSGERTWAIRALEPGSYEVLAVWRDRPTWSRTVQIAPGGTVRIAVGED